VRTFIVRVQEDTGGSGRTAAAAPRLRGVVDEVSSGLRATFRNDHELVTALMTAMGADPAGPSWYAGDLAPREPYQPNQT
jgi:hypothetical protein